MSQAQIDVRAKLRQPGCRGQIRRHNRPDIHRLPVGSDMLTPKSMSNLGGLDRRILIGIGRREMGRERRGCVDHQLMHARLVIIEQREQLHVRRQRRLRAGRRVDVSARRPRRAPNDNEHRPDVGIRNLDAPRPIIAGHARRVMSTAINPISPLAIPGVRLDTRPRDRRLQVSAPRNNTVIDIVDRDRPDHTALLTLQIAGEDKQLEEPIGDANSIPRHLEALRRGIQIHLPRWRLEEKRVDALLIRRRDTDRRDARHRRERPRRLHLNARTTVVDLIAHARLDDIAVLVGSTSREEDRAILHPRRVELDAQHRPILGHPRLRLGDPQLGDLRLILSHHLNLSVAPRKHRPVGWSPGEHRRIEIQGRASSPEDLALIVLNSFEQMLNIGRSVARSVELALQKPRDRQRVIRPQSVPIQGFPRLQKRPPAGTNPIKKTVRTDILGQRCHQRPRRHPRVGMNLRIKADPPRQPPQSRRHQPSNRPILQAIGILRAQALRDDLMATNPSEMLVEEIPSPLERLDKTRSLLQTMLHIRRHQMRHRRHPHRSLVSQLHPHHNALNRMRRLRRAAGHLDKKVTEQNADIRRPRPVLPGLETRVALPLFAIAIVIDLDCRKVERRIHPNKATQNSILSARVTPLCRAGHRTALITSMQHHHTTDPQHAFTHVILLSQNCPPRA